MGRLPHLYPPCPYGAPSALAPPPPPTPPHSLTAPTPHLWQVAASRLDAQRGAFLAPDFRFGATDNNVTASFAKTLTKTSTKLGE
jgi:hypothetical protein